MPLPHAQRVALLMLILEMIVFLLVPLVPLAVFLVMSPRLADTSPDLGPDLGPDRTPDPESAMGNDSSVVLREIHSADKLRDVYRHSYTPLPVSLELPQESINLTNVADVPPRPRPIVVVWRSAGDAPENAFLCMGAQVQRRVVLTAAPCFREIISTDDFPNGLRVRAYGGGAPSSPSPWCNATSDEAPASHYCDVEVHTVVVNNTVGAVLLLLTRGLEDEGAGQGGLAAWLPGPGRSRGEYAPCILRGYEPHTTRAEREGEWHGALTRRLYKEENCGATSHVFCAAGPHENMCKVSAGSPLYCKGPQGVWSLVGISAGFCADDLPGELFIDVISIASWIGGYIQSWDPQP